MALGYSITRGSDGQFRIYAIGNDRPLRVDGHVVKFGTVRLAEQWLITDSPAGTV